MYLVPIISPDIVWPASAASELIFSAPHSKEDDDEPQLLLPGARAGTFRKAEEEAHR